MTIVDIAKKAGTSVTTVSRVLNNSPHVSEKTREKVKMVLEETGFVPNYMGSNLRASKSSRLLVVLPTIATSAYAELVQSITDEAHKCGYSVMFVVTNRTPEYELEYLRLLETKSFDGLILVATTLETPVIESVGTHFPIVICNSQVKNSKLSYVSIDNYQAAYEATMRLIKAGHRNIACVRYCNHIKNQEEREKGFLDAVREAKLSFPKHYLLNTNSEKSLDEQFNELFSRSDTPSAIVSFSDQSAIEAMQYIASKKMKLTKDIEIVGFGNVDTMGFVNHFISYISIPWHELGICATKLLMEKISEPTSVAKGLLLPYEYVPISSNEQKCKEQDS